MDFRLIRSAFVHVVTPPCSLQIHTLIVFVHRATGNICARSSLSELHQEIISRFLTPLLFLLLHPPRILDVLALVSAPSHTSAPSLSNFRVSVFLFYSLVRQGAEAQSDAAAQRTQVPAPRLRRVSEAQDRLLWLRVARRQAKRKRET